jgi:hypothetical protein
VTEDGRPGLSISPYRELAIEVEALRALRRLGISEARAAQIIRNPLRTERDKEGRVVSVQRDHSTGAFVFIHHQTEPDGPEPKAGQGVRDFSTHIQLVRLVSARGVEIG